MFGNYYIDHKTFNIITKLFFNSMKFCYQSKMKYSE